MKRRVFFLTLPLAAFAIAEKTNSVTFSATDPAAIKLSNKGLNPAATKQGIPMHIRPYQPTIDAPMITDLRHRLATTRWSDSVADDWSYGTAPQALRDLVGHWQSGYDWAQAAERLRALPHFRAEIDGFGVHFLHFKGRGPKPQPLLLMNGWPSSFIEYAKLAPMLADPASHGGDAADAFDVVIPAHPGFGYSDRPTTPNQVDTVDLFHRLMTEGLGYDSFIASGTDVGSGVATRMALKYPASLRGIHISALVDPPMSPGAPFMPTLSEAENTYLKSVQTWREDEGGYMHVQSTRPQTLAYGLNDSPAGLASWITEKFRFWSDAGADLFAVFPKDMLLDNVGLYWATQTIASSMRYYYEARHFRAPLQIGDRVSVPTAVCMWPKDLVVGPKEYAQRFYNVRQYSLQPHGGHFPAWEQPDLYTQDLRRFHRALNNNS